METVRDFRNEDMESVMQIWLEETIKAHDFIPRQYWENNYRRVKDLYLPVSKTLVAEEAGEISGFVSVMEEHFIGALFVAGSRRRQGIGKRLLSACKNRRLPLTLAVYIQNTGAVRFYLSQDFSVTTKQLNEDSGFEEYLMRWMPDENGKRAWEGKQL